MCSIIGASTIFRAGGRLAKAEGRRPDALASRPCRPRRTLLAKSGHTLAGKGPPSNRSDFFAMRYTLSTIYHMT